jgi:tetratricopeptide (TPR) repeat protein
MLARLVLAFAVIVMLPFSAEARRVALVIGQNAYPGGASATVGLPKLYNSVPDARSMAALLAKHGFDIISCDGQDAGCLDLNREALSAALTRLQDQARGADLALVYFAGHGVATPEGNILAPLDARVNCETGAVTRGVPMEQILEATRPARDKLVLLDACRDNPLGAVCPNLRGKALSFTRIEAGAMRGLLLVTSTQFGQQALDGPVGSHSPFATALFAAFEANPGIYFEQVMNEVARATYDAAQKLQAGFQQIPGKVVGGAAPADCLAGKDCVGDPRMAALSADNERLAADAAGVRNILADEEAARGKSYTSEEREQRSVQLQSTLQSIGKSADPLRQEARRLIQIGNVAGGTAKLDQALDADEKAATEAERIAVERRKAGAQAARDLAVLATGRDAIKVMSYYRRATVLDPDSAGTWIDFARTTMDAGRLAEAKAAYEKAVATAQASNNASEHYWALLGLGDVATDGGSLPDGRRAYEAAAVIADGLAKAEPGNPSFERGLAVSKSRIGDVLFAQGNLPGALAAYKASLDIFSEVARVFSTDARWQHDLSISQDRVGDMLVEQGNLLEALAIYRAALKIRERWAKADPDNAGWQRDLSLSHNNIGDMLLAQGNLSEALAAYRAALGIRSKLTAADPGNASWQRDLSVSQDRTGDALIAQGNLPEALAAYRASFDILSKLTTVDPGNAGWRRDLSTSQNNIGDVLFAQSRLPEALAVYRASLDIVNELARTDPGNTDWQRDVSVSYDKIGGVLAAQNDLSGALAAYRTALGIVEKLANSDASNAAWQRDLAVSHNKVGDMLSAQGDLARALAAYRTAFDIADALDKKYPDNAGRQSDLAFSHGKIGEAWIAQGNLQGGLAAYRAAFSLREKLAKAVPGNAGWQRELALSYGKVGSALMRQGEADQAQAAFRAGRIIIESLRALAPDNANLPRDLAWFDAQFTAVRQ